MSSIKMQWNGNFPRKISQIFTEPFVVLSGAALIEFSRRLFEVDFCERIKKKNIPTDSISASAYWVFGGQFYRFLVPKFQFSPQGGEPTQTLNDPDWATSIGRGKKSSGLEYYRDTKNGSFWWSSCFRPGFVARG